MFKQLRDISITKVPSFSSTFYYEQNFPAVISTKKKSRIRIRVNFAFVSRRDAFPVIFFLLYIIFVKICYTRIYLLQTANNNCSNNSIQEGFFFFNPSAESYGCWEFLIDIHIFFRGYDRVINKILRILRYSKLR